uniref:Permease n=1 Tax=Solibacter usitatus (strain Ellin6076) TaxID=234267 RepID=Q01Z02_SOLUE
MFAFDVRYALRLMRRSPAFTAVAILSLALGIGANTAIYSLFYTIMLRTLPVAHPEQLVQLLQDFPGDPHWQGYWGWPAYLHFRDHARSFSAITGMSFDNLAQVRIPGSDTETLIQENVLENYFQFLGLTPALGRFIAPHESDVVVVSWSFWNRRFHRDPAILGRRITVGADIKTIIGVAPRAYTGPRVGVQTDLWIPVENNDLTMLARLKPGVTLAQARAEMAVLYRTLLAQRNSPRDRDKNIDVVPAGAGLVRVRDQFDKPLLLLLVVVGLLLLLACVNMASMLLARSAGRQREFAVRVSLGAGRARMAGQMLTESVLLAAAGALAGTVVAYFLTGVLVRIMASGRTFERIEIDVQPDLHLILVTAAIALLTGLLFGLAPAWYAFRTAPATALRQCGRHLFGKILVSAQVALSILLVTAAALFLGHLSRLRNFDRGFRSDHVLMVTLDPSRSSYRREQLAAPYQELLARLQSLPGVRAVSIAGCTPLQGCGAGSRFLTVAGFTERPEDQPRTAIAFVAPRYFESLGMPLLAGRDFTLQDAARPRVAIVSQAVARHYFPAVSPIGKGIMVNPDPKPYEIVGIVGEMTGAELRDPAYPFIYFNMFQENHISNQFVLRTSVEPESLTAAVRQTMRSVLKTVPITRVSTLDAQVDSNFVPERLIASLSGFFGAIGALLAGIGLYGLLAYAVARRTHEIGIRMALGATTSHVRSLVLRDALGMLSAGLAAGALMVLWSRPLAKSLVGDLKFESPAPLAIGAAIITAIAMLAGYLPARRAARVDPMTALRHE